jgi:hypothetical protein
MQEGIKAMKRLDALFPESGHGVFAALYDIRFYGLQARSRFRNLFFQGTMAFCMAIRTDGIADPQLESSGAWRSARLPPYPVGVPWPPHS